MFSILFSALILAANPAPAAEPVPAKTAATPKKEGKICRVPSEQTGTRMQRRICRTATEWALLEEGRSAEDLKTMGSN